MLRGSSEPVGNLVNSVQHLVSSFTHLPAPHPLGKRTPRPWGPLSEQHLVGAIPVAAAGLTQSPACVTEPPITVVLSLSSSFVRLSALAWEQRSLVEAAI